MTRFLSHHAATALVVGSLGVALMQVEASAQSVESFYAGRQITIYAGSTPGSGYDAIARLVSKHMGKYIPGQPTFIIKNMPGAGGVVATNFVNNVAEKDGSVIAVVGREAILDPIFSDRKSQAKYDPRKFVWLGTPNQDIGMAYAMTVSGVRNIQDAMKREVVVAASGVTSGSAVLPRLLNALIGTKFKIVTGYPGASEAKMAMERGEAEARVLSGFTGPDHTIAWVHAGKAVLLLQIAVHKDPRFSDVPNIMEFAKSEDEKKLYELLFIGQSLGRPFFAPPGVPADRAKVLQEAFQKTMRDPEYLADSAAQYFDNTPLFADEMLAIVNKVYDAPKPILEKAIALMAVPEK